MSSELEERLRRAGGDLPEPPAEATARIRSAALESLSAPLLPSRLRRTAVALRRPIGILATAGAFGGIAVLLGLLIVAGPSSEDAVPGSLRPDLSSLTSVRTCLEPRLREPCVAGTPQVRAATPALRDAPWLYGTPVRRLGSERPRPSLIFPAGTTYGQALDALYVSAVLTGALPPNTTLGPPLPQGAVLLRPTDPAQGIAIDLRAPFGYTPPHGMIFGAIYSGTPSGPTRGRLWPPGLRIAVPTLPVCMIISNRASVPPKCGPSDGPSIRGTDRSIQALPKVMVAADLVPGYASVAGPVVSRSPASWFSGARIGVGSADGVLPDSPVVFVTSSGPVLVGRVTKASSRTAEVAFITDGRSVVGATVSRAGSRPGVLRSPAVGKLVLERVPGSMSGEVVVTSGLAAGTGPSIYPRGLRIGLVARVGDPGSRPGQEIEVVPTRDPGSLTELTVLVPRTG